MDDEEEEDEEETFRKNQNLHICILIAIAVLLLIVVIVLAIVLINKDEDQDEKGAGEIGDSICRLRNDTDQSTHTAVMVKCERIRSGRRDKRCRVHQFTIVTVGEDDKCGLRFLLVGGGGGSNSEAGAGSGFLTYVDEQTNAKKGAKLYVKAGEQQRHSFLLLGEVHYEAREGEDASDSSTDGGNGFSGGGKAGGFDGGSNGADGGGDGGGRGEGYNATVSDLDTFEFETWLIEPGRGGFANQ